MLLSLLTVKSQSVVWIPVTGAMQGSREAMIHRTSSFFAPRDENHNTGPYLTRSLPKHTWRHMARAYTYTHKQRDNNLTPKHKIKCNNSSSYKRNLVTVILSEFWQHLSSHVDASAKIPFGTEKIDFLKDSESQIQKQKKCSQSLTHHTFN